jgi:hypothetical protein
VITVLDKAAYILLGERKGRNPGLFLLAQFAAQMVLRVDEEVGRDRRRVTSCVTCGSYLET